MRGFVVLVWNTSTGAIVSVTRYVVEQLALDARDRAKLVAGQDAVVLDGR